LVRWRLIPISRSSMQIVPRGILSSIFPIPVLRWTRP
jgi:hypothetical protein